nr:reverse transcriptase domain-containing protein [Tanacetum cinerariifolium]
MEDELRNLEVKNHDIATYTHRFNELAMLYPEIVPTEKKKIKQYISGLPSSIKGETIVKGKAIATGANTVPVRVCYRCGDPTHLANSDQCPAKRNQKGGNAAGHVYALKDEDQAQGPNVVT